MQVSTHEPTLFSVEKSLGDKNKFLLLLIAHIATLNKFIKTNDNLTNEEIEYVANVIYSDYRLIFTFADINLIFDNAKRGKYGKLYNRLSASDIIGWFEDYQLRKDEAITLYRQREAEQFNSIKATCPYHFETNPNGGIRIVYNTPDGNPPPPKKSLRQLLDEHDKAKADEYQRIRQEQIYKSILAKPESERTDSERDFLIIYKHN